MCSRLRPRRLAQRTVPSEGGNRAREQRIKESRNVCNAAFAPGRLRERSVPFVGCNELGRWRQIGAVLCGLLPSSRWLAPRWLRERLQPAIDRHRLGERISLDERQRGLLGGRQTAAARRGGEWRIPLVDSDNLAFRRYKVTVGDGRRLRAYR